MARTLSRHSDQVTGILQQLTSSQPQSSTEILTRTCPVPAESGVYAWHFRELPGCVDAAGCERSGDLWLLYIGISGTLRSRIRRHFRGDASRSTLRLTLGCLLGIELRVGKDGRWTFSAGEDAISKWMDRNALVSWVRCAQPGKVEKDAIRLRLLPLNLGQ